MNALLFENSFTYFAPPVRLSKDKVLEQSKSLEKFQDILHLLEGSSVVIVLNQYRQLVYCNEAFLKFTNMEHCDINKLIGHRPGEILNCIHSQKNEPGCGTSEYCINCGAVQAIVAGQKGERTSKECMLTMNTGSENVSLELLITAAPFSLKLQEYVAVFVTDISDEKRRKNLERIFFHDVMNTAGGLHGLVQLLSYSGKYPELKDYLQDVEEVSNTLLEEIKCQRDLVNAENNELVVHLKTVQSMKLLEETIKHLLNHDVAKNKSIIIDNNINNVCFETDPVLLIRVLSNMVKNALEASVHGDTITIGSNSWDGRIDFWVNNPTVMPRVVQLQVFQRSFSTKGYGRGLGTYSINLLTERYLKGTVSFHVSETEGTTFTVSLPLNGQD